MASYVSLWVQIGPYRSFCVLMDSDGSLCVFIRPYRSVWVLLGSYESLCILMTFNRVLMGPYRSLCVFMGLMGPYRSLFVLNDSNGTLLVLIDLYSTLLIQMGPIGS